MPGTTDPLLEYINNPENQESVQRLTVTGLQRDPFNKMVNVFTTNPETVISCLEENPKCINERMVISDNLTVINFSSTEDNKNLVIYVREGQNPNPNGITF